MKVLFVAAEAAPLAKVGGLADVVASLPGALIGQGLDVRVMLPHYGAMDLSRYQVTAIPGDFQIEMLGRVEPASLKTIEFNGKIPVYLVGNNRYFGGKEIYAGNDLERFFFFSRAVYEILFQLDWQPDIIHCHDWHTALLLMWLKKAGFSGASVFTIHNLAYQGSFDDSFLARSGMGSYWYDLHPDAPAVPLNCLGQGILSADMVTTVSETYAREIVTPKFGEGLDPLLRHRQDDLIGIVNGIDYEVFNPKADQFIAATFDDSMLEARMVNKMALQKRANLPRDVGIPVIGMVQRLDEQKGFDILGGAVEAILHETGAQMIILGKGREHYENVLKHMAEHHPQQIGLFIGFDEALAHLIYAGCDIFLMPSRFEPCGLGQLIAMHYGALPAVHHVGGLVDTVPELTPDLKEGRGFVFRDYSAEALMTAVRNGVEAFSHKEAWRQTMRRLMGLDLSWQASARKYEAAYRNALEKKAGRS
ncbi:MAG: glycogen synthase [Chloroflexi bacterium]|nr:glycogen synthase [Chloroflexota bacterium]